MEKNIRKCSKCSLTLSGYIETVSGRCRRCLKLESDNQAKKIKLALEEANEIHAGRKKATSFDEFLAHL